MRVIPKPPNKFINRIKSWHLNEPLGLAIIGEGKPEIPAPGDKKWSRNALPSMAYGYNLSLTPLQTLTFYNAIANDGEMVKPHFLREVREFDKTIETVDKKVIEQKICSEETIKKLQEILKNIVDARHRQKLVFANISPCPEKQVLLKPNIGWQTGQRTKDISLLLQVIFPPITLNILALSSFINQVLKKDIMEPMFLVLFLKKLPKKYLQILQLRMK